jgi:histidinol phosphatase-like enzyme
MYHDRSHTLNELKTAITAFIRNISQTDLQKVFVKKLNWFRPVSARVDITSNKAGVFNAWPAEPFAVARWPF